MNKKQLNFKTLALITTAAFVGVAGFAQSAQANGFLDFIKAAIHSATKPTKKETKTAKADSTDVEKKDEAAEG